MNELVERIHNFINLNKKWNDDLFIWFIKSDYQKDYFDEDTFDKHGLFGYVIHYTNPEDVDDIVSRIRLDYPIRLEKNQSITCTYSYVIKIYMIEEIWELLSNKFFEQGQGAIIEIPLREDLELDYDTYKGEIISINGVYLLSLLKMAKEEDFLIAEQYSNQIDNDYYYSLCLKHPKLNRYLIRK